MRHNTRQNLRRLLLLSLWSVALPIVSRADITSSLVAHWKFDERSGVVASDSSGNANHATLLNFQPDDSMWVTGRLGGALQFNLPEGGDDDQVLTDGPIVFQNQDTFTFSFWAKRQPGANPFNPRFLTPVGNEHWVLWSPGVGVGFYVPAPTADPPTGAWRHYAVLFNRAAGWYSVYVDGARVVNEVAATRGEAVDLQWVIGHKELLDDHRDPWRGFLDDMRVYNRLLAEGDITELYSQASAVAPTIVTPPQAAAKFAGDAYTFSVVVDGTAPMRYQWSKDGAALAGATNATLVLTNLQPSSSGVYSVAVSNLVSSVTSPGVRLDVTDPPVDISSDLVLHYKFDESSGLVATDSSGKGNHASLQFTVGDGTEWGEGRIGGAIRLNPTDGGNDDYVITDSPVVLPNQNQFTFAFWAKLAPGSGVNPRIVTPTTGHWVLWTPGTGVGFFTPSASPEPLLDVWRHFAVVYDREAGTYQLFVDGQRSGGEITGRVRTEPGESQWIIGHSESVDSLADAFAGWLDDVRVYNRQLSGKDIAAIYALAPSLAPKIASSPKSVIAASGSTLTLAVVAEGTALRYQWLKDGMELPGATSSTLTLAPVTASEMGSYSVTARNGDGQATSDAAIVTVIPVLNLASAPARASGVFNETFPPENAFDGLRLSTGPNSSRWASPSDSAPHWLSVDLGEDVLLRHVLLDWEGAFGVDYVLRGRTAAEGTSDDPATWTELASISGYAQPNHGLDGADVVYDFINHTIVLQSNTAEAPLTSIVPTQPKVRYLLLDGQTSSLGLFSVWELQVSGEGSTPVAPSLSAARAGNSITIRWPADATGFTLESADAVAGSAWSAVAGVANNTITLPATGTRFFRLRR